MRRTGIGPWISSFDHRPHAGLTGAWKKRLLLLPHLTKYGGRTSRAAFAATAIAAVAAVLFPIVRLTPAPAAAPSKVDDSAKTAVDETARAPGQPFRVNLPGGAVAEIVAIGRHPSQGSPWWGPDGHPAPQPYHSFAGRVGPDKSEFVRELAMRWITKPPEVVCNWSIVGGGSESGGRPLDANGKQIDGMNVKAHAFPNTAKTCSIRFDVGAGPWELVATSDGRSDFAIGTQKYTAAFAKAAMRSEGLSLSVAHNATEQNIRVVALDHQGAATLAPYSSSTGGRGFLQTTVAFPDLELKDVKEFRLEARPYQSVEVRKLSLVENEITRPEVVILENEATN